MCRWYCSFLLLLSCFIFGMEQPKSIKLVTKDEELIIDQDTLEIFKESITIKNMLEDMPDGSEIVIELSEYPTITVDFIKKYLKYIHAINHTAVQGQKEKLEKELHRALIRLSVTGLQEIINLSNKLDIPLLLNLSLSTLTDEHALASYIKTGNFPTFNKDIETILAQKLLSAHAMGKEIISWIIHYRNLMSFHKFGVQKIAFSPLDDIVATSKGGILSFWDHAGTTLTYCCEQENDAGINALTVNSRQKLLALGLDDNTIHIYNFDTQKTFLLRNHSYGITSLAWISDTLLASGSIDKTIKLWNIGTHKVDATLSGHTGKIFTLSANPSKAELASAGGDAIKIWDIANQKIVHTLVGHTRRINCVVYNTHGTLLASGSEDKTVMLWNPQNGTLRSTLHGHTQEVTSVAFNQDGSILVSGSADKTVRVWNSKTSENIYILNFNDEINDVVFIEKPQLIVVGTDKQLAVINHEAILKEQEQLEKLSLKTLFLCAAAYNAYEDDRPLTINNPQLINDILSLSPELYEFLTKKLKVSLPLSAKIKHYLKKK